MRHAATLALVLVLVLLVTLIPAEPASASTRRVCARSAQLRDSPEGIVVGYLRRRDRVRYIRRSANRRWALVKAETGTIGWIIARRLCRA